MVDLQDSHTWSRWLRDTRVAIRPQATQTSVVPQPFDYVRGAPRRGLRPQLSDINYLVLALFAKSDILLPDLTSSGSSVSLAVPIPRSGLTENCSPVFCQLSPGQLDSRSKPGNNRQTRLFCSAFQGYAGRSSIKRIHSGKCQRRAHPIKGRMTVCMEGKGSCAS